WPDAENRAVYRRVSRCQVWQGRGMIFYDGLDYTHLPQGDRMPFKVQEIQPTPNPDALKFILDQPISERPVSFFNAAAAKDHPQAKQLFDIQGVSSLLFLGDFVTINKS